MIQFTDPAVAAKYTTDQTEDKIIHFPGGSTRKGWRGKLSEIPLEIADYQITKNQQNLIKLKEIPAVASGKGKGKSGQTDEPATEQA